MGTEDVVKGMDWKSIGEAEGGGVKKRVPKKMRQVPDYYFLPRRSFAFYGSWIVGGIGAGMLAQVWINNKIKEDGGGVIWEFDK